MKLNVQSCKGKGTCIEGIGPNLWPFERNIRLYYPNNQHTVSTKLKDRFCLLHFMSFSIQYSWGDYSRILATNKVFQDLRPQPSLDSWTIPIYDHLILNWIDLLNATLDVFITMSSQDPSQKRGTITIPKIYTLKLCSIQDTTSEYSPFCPCFFMRSKNSWEKWPTDILLSITTFDNNAKSRGSLPRFDKGESPQRSHFVNQVLYDMRLWAMTVGIPR